MITNSLSPANVTKVQINEDDRTALVIVPRKQLSLAIGKEGQNARLAAKLTLWKIDVQPEEDQIKEIAEEIKDVQIEITETKENITESEKEEVSEVVQTMDEEILLQEDLVDDSAELMALEKEIQELEEKEQKEKILQKQKEDILDFSSEDIWDLGGAKGSEKSDDTIRFAEDISGFYETDEGRKGGKRGGSSAKSKRRK